jgi:glycine cleavage system T protein (aminomethyltransferase)
MELKKTAFHEIHRSLGAKMVAFGGFEMPIQYTGIIEEHRQVRSAVGLFDVSHMGEIEIRGRDALEFVQRVTINDASRLVEGKVQYSAMCYEEGGIVDDLLVYHMGDHYMLVVNASNIEKNFSWLQQHMGGDVRLKNRSDEISLLAIQGPQSLALLQKITSVNLASIDFYHFVRHKLAGVDMVISRTGYTGEMGFELYFPSDTETGTVVWNAIMREGKNLGCVPVGLGARDTLRLEMGYCLYGQDIDNTTNPLEAGLGWLTKLEKGPFVGREALQRFKRDGLRRKLVGFSTSDKAFPRPGYVIYAGGNHIGKVTSGTFSPSLGKGIGLGYVDIGHAKPGTQFEIDIRNRRTGAMAVPLPFIKKQ